MSRWYVSAAYADGIDWARAVMAGRVTVESAGDRWVRWADQAHSLGVDYRSGYDHVMTGGE